MRPGDRRDVKPGVNDSRLWRQVAAPLVIRGGVCSPPPSAKLQERNSIKPKGCPDQFLERSQTNQANWAQVADNRHHRHSTFRRSGEQRGCAQGGGVGCAGLRPQGPARGGVEVLRWRCHILTTNRTVNLAARCCRAPVLHCAGLSFV